MANTNRKSSMDFLHRFDACGNEKIQCKMCSRWYHQLGVHLASAHGATTAIYAAKFPGTPTISAFASAQMSAGQKAKGTVVPNNNHLYGATKAVGAFKSATEAKPVAVEKEQAENEQAENEQVVAEAASNPSKFQFGAGIVSIVPEDELSAIDKAFIPRFDEYFDHDDNTMEALALAVELNAPAYLWGHTGCGKTSHIFQLGAVLSQPVRRLNCRGDMMSKEFLGDKVLVVDAQGNDVIEWRDGILTDAMRRGHWLIVDEMDAAKANILLVLQSVLEGGVNGYTLVLGANHGEVVKAHPRFRIFATGNTNGRGENAEWYPGTQILNDAFLDRFIVKVHSDYPDLEREASIVADKSGINKGVAFQMVTAAGLVRVGVRNGDCLTTFSTRRLIAWAIMANKCGVSKAAKLTFLDGIGCDDRVFIADCIHKATGHKLL